MSIDLAPLKDQIATLSGLQTVWAHEPRPMVDPSKKALIELSVRNTDEYPGTLEVRRTYDEDTPANPAVVSQTIIFSLTVKCEQFANSSGVQAWQALEDLRRKLQWPAPRKALAEDLIVLNSFSNTIPLPTSYDSQVISCFSLDIKGTALDVDDSVDADEAAGDWIETVNGDDWVPYVP